MPERFTPVGHFGPSGEGARRAPSPPERPPRMVTNGNVGESPARFRSVSGSDRLPASTERPEKRQKKPADAVDGLTGPGAGVDRPEADRTPERTA